MERQGPAARMQPLDLSVRYTKIALWGLVHPIMRQLLHAQSYKQISTLACSKPRLAPQLS